MLITSRTARMHPLTTMLVIKEPDLPSGSGSSPKVERLGYDFRAMFSLTSLAAGSAAQC
jgi:hypothetical protein